MCGLSGFGRSPHDCTLLLIGQTFVCIKAGHVHFNFAARKWNAMLLETFFYAIVYLPADYKLCARFGHKFAPHNHANIVKVEYPLRFERLQHVICDFGNFHQLLTNLLEKLLHQVGICVKRHGKFELGDNPITAVIGDLGNVAVRNCVNCTAMMAELHGAD